ncbi:hypothetical protein BC938DRAFT_475232, partial [Jimgerdemannia flammicorona]
EGGLITPSAAPRYIINSSIGWLSGDVIGFSSKNTKIFNCSKITSSFIMPAETPSDTPSSRLRNRIREDTPSLVQPNPSRRNDTPKPQSTQLTQNQVTPKPQITPKSILDSSDNHEEGNSDDEAPEAVSISSSKIEALQAAQLEKEFSQKLQAAQKEKRRQRDTKLKEQKEGSKRSKKTTFENKDADTQETSIKRKNQPEKPPQTEHDVSNTLVADQISETRGEVDKDGTEMPFKKPVLPTLLPLDMLEDVAKEEAEQRKKRKHLRLDDFDAIAKEEEEEGRETKNKLKRKKTKTEGKKVGPFTVVILDKPSPKPAPVASHIQNFRESHFFGNGRVPRKDAILNISQKNRGAAAVFRRQNPAGPPLKKI